MPFIGQIKRNLRNQTYIWHACEVCGKERWVALMKGNPIFHRCRSCASRATITAYNVGRSFKGGRKRTKDGYFYQKLPRSDFFYSMVDANEYVFEHRLVMARHLGRCLHRWEIVHHKNHIKDDNRIENLQLTTDDRHNQITIMENKIKSLEKRVILLEVENVVLRQSQLTNVKASSQIRSAYE